eukprot:jgi/Bigna1/82818/fgenesh1_pg.98_\
MASCPSFRVGPGNSVSYVCNVLELFFPFEKCPQFSTLPSEIRQKLAPPGILWGKTFGGISRVCRFRGCPSARTLVPEDNLVAMPSPLRSLLCSLLSLWGIVSTQGHPSEGWEAKKYPCVVCDSLVESLFDGQHFDEACESMQVCDFLAPHRDGVLRAFKGVPGGPKAWANASSALARDTVSRMVCEGVGLCEAVKDMAITSTGIPDVRVTPVYASKGYAYVRVSLIDDASAAEDITTTPSDLFTYSQPFRYRWTDKRLSSGLLKVAPGESTKVTIQGTDFDIYLPEEGQGTRGVIIADPCFSGKWVGCQYGSTLQTLKRRTKSAIHFYKMRPAGRGEQ